MMKAPWMNNSARMVTAGAVAALALNGTSFGHEDIELEYDNNKIVIDDDHAELSGDLGLVLESEFPTSGLFVRQTVDPGFNTHDGALNPGDAIDYNILESPHGYLVYWDPATQAFTVTNANILIENNPSGETVVSANGFTRTGTGIIGEANNNGRLHTHVEFILSEGADYGAYGFLMELTTDASGIASSDPFWIVFNYGMDHGDFDEQALPAFAAIPEPGTLALAGAGMLVVLARRRRAMA